MTNQALVVETSFVVGNLRCACCASASSIIVALNAVMLKRVERELPVGVAA